MLTIEKAMELSERICPRFYRLLMILCHISMSYLKAIDFMEFAVVNSK